MMPINKGLVEKQATAFPASTEEEGILLKVFKALDMSMHKDKNKKYGLKNFPGLWDSVMDQLNLMKAQKQGQPFPKVGMGQVDVKDTTWAQILNTISLFLGWIKCTQAQAPLSLEAFANGEWIFR
jgi:hypothetical protein